MAEDDVASHTAGVGHKMHRKLRGEYVEIEFEQAPVTNDQHRRRFEVHVGDRTAELTYDMQGDRITLIHTEVPEELEGHGIGGKLAAFALDYAREHGLRVVPSCSFVAAYIQRHPAYADLIASADTP